ncbi:tyrosine-type recombinase/integrase [Lentilactobacillus senioris]|uniref:tyrosine-type recombinase/integrase n=1 Tax=Lentilactobacillus senioris TaxID=931534 RepID=UPI00227DB845|nr:tyrosine-type recombinase/integrase [Lentilactobacillus senioris]MCY9807083.1 tyrosine-type recombinase/integrase [Lentilactobacillus senioris]
MASYRKRGKTWQVRVSYKDMYGNLKRIEKGGFRTKKEAEVFSSGLIIDDAKGKNVDIKKYTFVEYFEKWYKTYKAPSLSYITIMRYEVIARQLNKYFGNALLKDINRVIYQKFINDYGSTHAKDTVHKINSIIRSCIKNAILDDIIYKDFTESVVLTYNEDKIRKVEYLNLNEIQQLASYLNEKSYPKYSTKQIILTGLLTGARIGEILALTWDDINFNFKTISITKSWDYKKKKDFGKTKTPTSVRKIRTDPLLLNVIKQLKQNHDVSGKNLVFVDENGILPSPDGVNKTLRDTLKKLGIIKRGFHFHSLRHAHVAYLLSKQVDIYVISKRLGHASISETMDDYGYLVEEYKNQQDDLVEKALDGLLQKDSDKKEAI